MPTTIPSVTSSTRPSSPSAGDAFFETDTKNFVIYDGAQFRIFNRDGSNTPTFPNVYSVQMDGSDDRVVYDSTSGNQTSLGAFTGDMSFTLWFRQNSTSSGFAVIISSFHHLTTSDSFQGKFDMDISSGTGLRTFVRDGGSGGFSNTSAGTVVNNSWNFIAYVVDTSTNKHNLYVGQPTSAPSLQNSLSTTETVEDFSNGFKLGDGQQSNLNGYVDDFAIFNGKALSSSEVSTIWNNGSSFNFAADSSLNPVGWYRMGDDNSGTGILIKNAINTNSAYDADLDNGTFSTLVY